MSDTQTDPMTTETAVMVLRQRDDLAAKLGRHRHAEDEVIASLCELAEEQEGNPHDALSVRLYEIANILELAQIEPVG